MKKILVKLNSVTNHRNSFEQIIKRWSKLVIINKVAGDVEEIVRTFNFVETY